MLLKIERRILYTLSKRPYEHQINVYEIGKYSGTDIFQAMKSLKDKGYLDSIDATSDYERFSYVLSIKGRCYKEYLFRVFLSDVIIPIIVSIFTTLITLYITS